MGYCVTFRDIEYLGKLIMGIFGSLYWDTCPLTSRVMGYLVPPIQASLMSGLSYYEPEQGAPATSRIVELATVECELLCQ